MNAARLYFFFNRWSNKPETDLSSSVTLYNNNSTDLSLSEAHRRESPYASFDHSPIDTTPPSLAYVASVSVWFRSKEILRKGTFGFDRARNETRALLLAPLFSRSLTLVPRSFLLNRTETLATQATPSPSRPRRPRPVPTLHEHSITSASSITKTGSSSASLPLPASFVLMWNRELLCLSSVGPYSHNSHLCIFFSKEHGSILGEAKNREDIWW